MSRIPTVSEAHRDGLQPENIVRRCGCLGRRLTVHMVMPMRTPDAITAESACRYVKCGNVKSPTPAQFHSSQKTSPMANMAMTLLKRRPMHRRDEFSFVGSSLWCVCCSIIFSSRFGGRRRLGAAPSADEILKVNWKTGIDGPYAI